MKRRVCFVFALSLLAAKAALAAEASRSADLRRAVPADVYLAVYSRHNPERDYQRRYFREVWDAVRETQIIEQVVKLAASHVSEKDLQQAKSIWQEVREAASPIDIEAILGCEESVYAQFMQVPAAQQPVGGQGPSPKRAVQRSVEVPTAQHLVVLRLKPEAASSTEQGVKNLFGLVEKYSKGAISIQTAEEGAAKITALIPPPIGPLEHAPYRPAIARAGDVLVLSSSDQLARKSLAMLLGKGGESKFDDPRLKEALRQLPEPEDSVAFYDGKLQFSQLRGLGQYMRRVSGDDREIDRVAQLIELLFDELSVLDYEVTVEYTEGNRNCAAAYGKWLPGTENKLLAKALGGGRPPFEDWRRWVPAESSAYSLTMGVCLHPVYERVVAVIQERIPEAKKALERFEQLQSKCDVHLDRDILQAFSGESVSVSLPSAQPSLLGGQDTVTALRCHKPDRIRELLHRLVERLRREALVQSLQLQLTESKDLDGFEELSATPLAVFGARPVIGFRDGWMIIGSNAGAVKRVLDVKAGKGETIAEAQSFKQFGLEIEGPVYSVSYSNVAENVRRIAALLNQAGVASQVILTLAGAQGEEAAAVKRVQPWLGLLPSVAKVVSKFDFLEARMSVTQAGKAPGAYLRRSATLVRPAPPAAPPPAATKTSEP